MSLLPVGHTRRMPYLLFANLISISKIPGLLPYTDTLEGADQCAKKSTASRQVGHVCLAPAEGPKARDGHHVSA